MSPDQLAVRAASISRRGPVTGTWLRRRRGLHHQQPRPLKRTGALWWSAQPTEHLGRVEFTPDGPPAIIEPASTDDRGR
jgi:hypothetical protein